MECNGIVKAKREGGPRITQAMDYCNKNTPKNVGRRERKKEDNLKMLPKRGSIVYSCKARRTMQTFWSNLLQAYSNLVV